MLPAKPTAKDEGMNEYTVKWNPFKTASFLTLYNVINLGDPYLTDIFILALKCYPCFTQLPVFSFAECKQSETNKPSFFGWVPWQASFSYPCTNDVGHFQWSCWYVVNLAVWIWVQNVSQTWFNSNESFNFLRESLSLLAEPSHPNSCPFWMSNSFKI